MVTVPKLRLHQNNKGASPARPQPRNLSSTQRERKRKWRAQRVKRMSTLSTKKLHLSKKKVRSAITSKQNKQKIKANQLQQKKQPQTFAKHSKSNVPPSSPTLPFATPFSPPSAPASKSNRQPRCDPESPNGHHPTATATSSASSPAPSSKRPTTSNASTASPPPSRPSRCATRIRTPWTAATCWACASRP